MTTVATRNEPALSIAIASGKGGTGKTFFATNLFNSLVLQGVPVTLVDCDAEGPNVKVFFGGQKQDSFPVTRSLPVINEQVCNFCGKCRTYCNFQAIVMLPSAGFIRVIGDLCHACGACRVACDQGAIFTVEEPLGEVSRYPVAGNAEIIEARMMEGVLSPVPLIKSAVREAGSRHLVLLDAPPGTSCPFIHTVSGADYVVLVTEPTPFGLSDLKQSVDCLRLLDKRYGVVINRSGLGNLALYQFLEEEAIPLLMEIPFERGIASAYSRGRLVSTTRKGFRQQLLQVFENICHTCHGDSHR